MSTNVDTSRSRWRATSISGLWPDTSSATRCAQSRLASGGMAVVKLVATLSSYGRRAVVAGGVADRYASELARAGQSNRRRAGTGSASSECATRPPLWPAGMAEGNRETFGPRVGLSSHGSPAKGGPKSKCLARVKIARTSAGPPSLTISDLVSPHVLRHTFATTALQKGISLPTVQKILGGCPRISPTPALDLFFPTLIDRSLCV